MDKLKKYLFKDLFWNEGKGLSQKTLCKAFNIDEFTLKEKILILEQEDFEILYQENRFFLRSFPEDRFYIELFFLFYNKKLPFHIFFKRKCASTNSLVKKEIQKYENQLSVLLCESQTNGRGRDTHVWLSNAGQDITLSVVFPIEKKEIKLFYFTMMAGIAVCRLLNGLVKAKLKWPNDILVNGKKIGGILIEKKATENLDYLIVGIGININSAPPLEIATSLSAELGQKSNLHFLIPQLLNHLYDLYEQYVLKNYLLIKNEWDSLLLWKHKKIILGLSSTKRISGIFLGVTENGEICLLEDEWINSYSVGSIESVF